MQIRNVFFCILVAFIASTSWQHSSGERCEICDLHEKDLQLASHEELLQITLSLYKAHCSVDKPAYSDESIYAKEQEQRSLLRHKYAPHEFASEYIHQQSDALKEQYVASADSLRNFPGNAQSQRQTLKEFYEALDGHNWFNNTGWDASSSSCYCSWFGVECFPCDEFRCSMDVCMVQNLNLKRNNLAGDALVALPILEKLPLLMGLDLSFNQIHGTFPHLALPQLLFLNINYNQIQGTIPDLATPNLLFLQLSSNLLTGSMPNFQLPSLIALEINSNPISGSLPDFTGIPSLSFVLITVTDISGSVPDFSSLRSAELIFLSGNKLSGAVPDFQHLDSILFIHFSANELTGTIPTFSKMPQLIRLDVATNAISGPLPSFATMPLLMQLYIFNNQLSGNINVLSMNPLLITILASSNFLTGDLTPVSRLFMLEELDLSRNQLTGTIPSFSYSPKLKIVLVFNNTLTGSIPDFRLPLLNVLDVGGNQLSGKLPSLTNTTMLGYLDVSSNNLYGSVPPSYSRFQFLVYAIFSSNCFSGKMDYDFFKLPYLSTLDISSNCFRESIDSFFTETTDGRTAYNITYLSLENNQFYGVLGFLPYFLFPSIRELDLSNNSISRIDPLPTVRYWRNVDVSMNPIVGSVPESWCLFSKLDYLDMRDTNMSWGVGKQLPSFLSTSREFNVDDPLSSFMCPSIVGNVAETTVFMDPSYYEHEFCRCLPNYYGKNNACQKCTSECECPGASIVRNCYPSTSNNSSVSLIRCPLPYACNPDESPTFACAEGHQGRLCSQCAKGYQQQGRECVKCLPFLPYVIPILYPLFVIAVVSYLVYTPPRSTGVIKIFLFYLQTLSVLSTIWMNIGGVSEFVETSFTTSSFTMPVIQCMLDEPSDLTMLLISFGRLPIILVGCIIGYILLNERQRDILVFVVLFLLQTTYYGLSRDVFSIFGCSLYDPGEDAYFLNAKPWIQCSPISPEYSQLLQISIPVAIVYVFSTPIALYRLLRHISKEKDAANIQRRYGFLYLSFKDQFHYWEIYVIARRILFSMVVSLIPYTEPTTLYVLLFTLLQISIWIQQYFSPYVRSLENRLESWSLYVIYFSFFGGIMGTFYNLDAWLSRLILAINMGTMLVFAYHIAGKPVWTFLSRISSSNAIHKQTPKDSIQQFSPIDRDADPVQSIQLHPMVVQEKRSVWESGTQADNESSGDV